MDRNPNTKLLTSRRCVDAGGEDLVGQGPEGGIAGGAWNKLQA